MNLLYGLALIAVTIAMVLLGRPRDGVSAPFLKVWIVGQLYVLIAMVSAVMGVAFVILDLRI